MNQREDRLSSKLIDQVNIHIKKMLLINETAGPETGKFNQVLDKIYQSDVDLVGSKFILDRSTCGCLQLFEKLD